MENVVDITDAATETAGAVAQAGILTAVKAKSPYIAGAVALAFLARFGYKKYQARKADPAAAANAEFDRFTKKVEKTSAKLNKIESEIVELTDAMDGIRRHVGTASAAVAQA